MALTKFAQKLRPSPKVSASHYELIYRLLSGTLPALKQKVYRRQLDALIKRYEHWAEQTDSVIEADSLSLTKSALTFLTSCLQQLRAQLDEEDQYFTQFTQRYHNSVSEEERNHHIIDYARYMGRNARQLRQDQSALRR